MLNPHQNTEIGEGGARELALALELNTAITSVDLNVRGGEGRGEVHAAWRQRRGQGRGACGMEAGWRRVITHPVCREPCWRMEEQERWDER